MTTEEQIEILDEAYEKLGEEVFPKGLYQSCKILVQNELAYISGINSETGNPMISATELGIAQCEIWDQEELQ